MGTCSVFGIPLTQIQEKSLFHLLHYVQTSIYFPILTDDQNPRRPLFTMPESQPTLHERLQTKLTYISPYSTTRPEEELIRSWYTRRGSPSILGLCASLGWGRQNDNPPYRFFKVLQGAITAHRHSCFSNLSLENRLRLPVSEYIKCANQFCEEQKNQIQFSPSSIEALSDRWPSWPNNRER